MTKSKRLTKKRSFRGNQYSKIKSKEPAPPTPPEAPEKPGSS